MINIALAQINPVVGDIEGNAQKIKDALREGESKGAQVVAVPELAVTGYPPDDLLFKRAFVRENVKAVEAIAAAAPHVLGVIGFVEPGHDRLYNAAAVCHGGRIIGVYRKQLLPNYGVFDERRYFEPGRGHTLIETPVGIIGVCVCEDIWSADGPAIAQGDAGAQVVVNINASPFHKGKLTERIEMLSERARRAGAAIAYVNTVGGQDEVVFDGGSVILDADGRIVSTYPQFREHLEVVEVPLGQSRPSRHPDIRRVEADLPPRKTLAPPRVPLEISFEEEIYQALVLALRDYVEKNGFERVVVGLSGGIDSALTATIATDALGADAVLGITMPSDYSTSHSIEDSKTLASNLGIELREIHIADTFHDYRRALENAFGESAPDLAEENLQARIRGNLLMAVSNRYGHLVVATGNKSEMACGYATLYGDMAGGFALLKDVFKIEVYALASYRNSLSRVIPQSTMDKPPSAELRPDQKDSDSLPPYDVLDPILEAYIEDVAEPSEIVALGYDLQLVQKVITLVDRAEYKRRQAPPGPKVTVKAFGRDRRLPITNAWRNREDADLPGRSLGDGPQADDG
ncbi:MAG: NAD+ synthase [Actinomycetota bacterium]|nr:NAD+ synthase [Actinomycetota bacterium]